MYRLVRSGALVYPGQHCNISTHACHYRAASNKPWNRKHKCEDTGFYPQAPSAQRVHNQLAICSVREKCALLIEFKNSCLACMLGWLLQ